MIPLGLLPESRVVVPLLVFIMGVVAFAAVHHFLIGLRRPSERVHLFFAGMCAAAFVWVLLAVPQALTSDPQVFALAIKGRIYAGNVIGVFLIWFIALYTGVKPRKFLWGMTGLHLVLFAVTVTRPYGPFAGPITLEFLELPWGDVVTRGTGPMGPWFYVDQFVPPIDFGFGFWASFKLWRAGRGREALPVLAALFALVLGLFGVYDLILGPAPAVELAFLGLVLVMSVATSDRVAEASVMEDALRTSERRLRTLVETAPEAVLLLEAESGTVLEVNDRASDLFQVDREQLLGSGPVRFAFDAQPDGEPSALVFQRRSTEAMRGGRPVFRWVVRRKDDVEVPCEARLVKLPGTDPSMLRLSLVDIQGLEEAEARQSLLEAQLRQAQRLESVGRLTGGVAHDFNNLLTVVQGNVELVMEDGGMSSEARDLLGEALGASRRGSELTRRLLAFSRQQNLESAPIDAGELLQDMGGLLRRTLEENVHLTAEASRGVRKFSADRAQLESALVNLAINARDAMPGGGRLSVTASNVDLLPDDEWPEEAVPGPYVCFSVTDDGEGMPEETAARAVEPFFTTKAVGKGSGLGLSMVYGFVSQSGGVMRIDSQVGVGTTVYLLFPAEYDSKAG